MTFDILEERSHLPEHLVRYFVPLLLSKHESVRNVDCQKRIFVPFLVALPKSEASVIALTRLQYLKIPCESGFKLRLRRHILSLECREYVVQRSDRDHSRCNLLGAVV